MSVDAARAKSLFLAASDLADPTERAAYLDRECGGDAELRERVEALLQANDESPLSALSETIDSEVSTTAHAATAEYIPEPDGIAGPGRPHYGRSPAG